VTQGTDRLKALSDGVFAIAATLLVIEVAVPDVPRGDLLSALRHEWPSFAGYAVSFAVIGVLWVNHNATVARVVVVDRGLLFWNLLVLGTVAFIPFPTALVAKYLGDGGSNATSATVGYALVMMACAASFATLWLYLGRHRELLAETCEPHAPQVAVRRALGGVGAYAATALLALLDPLLAVAAFFLLTVAFVFAERPAKV